MINFYQLLRLNSIIILTLHHQHGYPWPFFSRHTSLSSTASGRSSGVYIYIYIYISSSSSSYRAIRRDILDPLTPPFSIVHRFQQVFRATSRIGTEPLYVGFSWSSCLSLSIWRGPQEYITYELVLTSPVVSRMSGSSNFDSFHDGWLVAIQLLLCVVLPPWLVQYCSQYSCAVAVELFFSIRLVSVHVVLPYCSINTTAAWKKLKKSTSK